MSKHPWRQSYKHNQDGDSLVGHRSAEFAAYLKTLPARERCRIEAEERKYTHDRYASGSAKRALLKDFVNTVDNGVDSVNLAFQH